MRTRSNHLWDAWLVAPATIFLIVFFILPLLLVARQSLVDPSGSFTLEEYSQIATDPFYLNVIIRTIRIALLTTVLSFILGYPMALAISARTTSSLMRSVLYVILLVPLFTSSIVRSFGWLTILGTNGVVNNILLYSGIIERPLPLLYSEASVVVAMASVLLPFMVLMVSGALQTIPAALVEAARDLGASPSSAFMRVVFPLSLPGVVSGSLIVFVLGVSAYVTPAVMGGGKGVVMSMIVFQKFGIAMDYAGGSALAIVLLLTTMMVISLYLRLVGMWTR